MGVEKKNLVVFGKESGVGGFGRWCVSWVGALEETETKIMKMKKGRLRKWDAKCWVLDMWNN